MFGWNNSFGVEKKNTEEFAVWAMGKEKR